MFNDPLQSYETPRSTDPSGVQRDCDVCRLAFQPFLPYDTWSSAYMDHGQQLNLLESVDAVLSKRIIGADLPLPEFKVILYTLARDFRANVWAYTV